MKLTVYKCDGCDKVLSDGKTSIEHFSINFGWNSGWAMQISDEVEVGGYEKKWQVTNAFKGIKQFCNGPCLAKFVKGFKPEKKTIVGKRNKAGRWDVNWKYV